MFKPQENNLKKYVGTSIPGKQTIISFFKVHLKICMIRESTLQHVLDYPKTYYLNIQYDELSEIYC